MKQEQDVLAGYSHGADDYIGKPIDLAILAAKIDTILRQTRPAAPAPAARRRGAVIAFLHGKGGVGTTTCAVNVAAALAAEGAKCTIVDLNLQFGNAAMFLDLRPKYSIVDLARADLARVTDEDFGQFLTDHPSGIRILAAPPSPEEADIVSIGAVQQAIELARGERDAVIIDLPARIDESALGALETADAVCVVTAPHLAALRATLDVLVSLVHIGAAEDRVLVALDRVTAKGIDDAGVAKFIKRRVDVVIPYTEKADAAADLGVPYVTAEPTDRTSLALKQLALKLSVHKPVPA
jgi:pilus assembly protein CpaE